MATLIPARGSCVGRMTSGEKQLAECLEQKLDDNYLLWYDVPIGPKQLRPDFIVLHPSRGLLILEVKDIKLSTLRSVDRETWHIHDSNADCVKAIDSPFSQARNYAHAVTAALSKDRQLIQPDGPRQGRLSFAWSYGVVLTHITRKQFNDAQMDQALEPQRVICKDEMQEAVDGEAFQSRLWDMFPYARYVTLSLPQIERIRWILFPQIRIGDQASLFDCDDDASEEVPDLLRVMDLQQEQLARSLGDGHRVIHGVAGSGKTMILSYRAEYLACAFQAGKPILVLCFNRALATKLAAAMRSKGLEERVHCRTFHGWCSQQLQHYGQAVPATDLARKDVFADQVQRVIRGVELGHIPAGQYMSVLIDEGHDFEPEWLKLVVQMVDPTTKSLLLLYDDAQSIYQKRRKGFSLKSVGIEAVGRGRTTIMRINYRNTRQVLGTARAIAQDLLTPQIASGDGVPLVVPISCGRDGPPPMVIDLPSPRQQAERVADALALCRNQGHGWGDMAVLYLDASDRYCVMQALKQRRMPHNEGFFVGADKIHVMAAKVSKGLEFPVVALLGGVARHVLDGDAAQDERRVLYVAATRATHQLIHALRQPFAESIR